MPSPFLTLVATECRDRHRLISPKVFKTRWRQFPSPIPIGLGRFNESLHLGLGQIFPRSQFGIGHTPRRNSPNNSVWRHQPQIAFSHCKTPTALIAVSQHCSFLGQCEALLMSHFDSPSLVTIPFD